MRVNVLMFLYPLLKLGLVQLISSFSTRAGGGVEPSEIGIQILDEVFGRD
jgi:hypothetical protein